MPPVVPAGKENDTSSASNSQCVQLGFSVEYEDQEHRMFVGHKLASWRDWDGGQIGGRPSWLQPKDLPKGYVKCNNCEEPMSFICQLYAPADDVRQSAFHRSLYVFVCASRQCATATTGSVRVLRTQLPKDNPYLPSVDDDDVETWAMHLPEAHDINLCHVCGQRSQGKCPVQGYHFCGKHHQKEHKKHVFDKQLLSKSGDFSFLPSVYHESELVVEEEPAEKIKIEVDLETGKSKTPLFASSADAKDGEKKPAANADTKISDNDDIDDEDLEQKDLNEMIGAGTATTAAAVTDDETTMQFYARINGPKNVQDQCLRYLRWPSHELAAQTDTPLWIHSDAQPTTVPDCSICGAQRKFEFQIMPQMIHRLLKDHRTQHAHAAVRTSLNTEERKKAIMAAANIIESTPPEQVSPHLVDANKKAIHDMQSELLKTEEDLEWGVISVYTCTGSCGDLAVVDEAKDNGGGSGGDDGSNAANANDLGAYREEFAWRQPSLDSR